MRNLLKNLGPGPLIAAAFIGPGTVTVCTLAGVEFGYELLWAMAVSIFATVILQEMAARLGIVSQKGLAEILRTEVQHPFLKSLMILLLIMAIIFGNAVYEAGNITGGVLGMETLFSDIGVVSTVSQQIYVLVIGGIAFVALFGGTYKYLERFLIILVVLMSIAFVSTALLTKPNIPQIASGLFLPKLKNESLFTVIALIGTTVVPYNLFLHASLAKTKWNGPNKLKFAKRDTIIAVVLGGMVSMAIIITAAELPLKEVKNTTDLARGLEPLFGEWARYLLSIGLIAAGITSAITAPLAAAFVACGCLGWSSDLKSFRFRGIWMLVLGLGVLFSSLGFKPITLIKFAQVANGILLPIIAVFLLWLMNNSKILGTYTNSRLQNGLGLIIVLITFILGVKGILNAVSP